MPPPHACLAQGHGTSPWAFSLSLAMVKSLYNYRKQTRLGSCSTCFHQASTSLTTQTASRRAQIGLKSAPGRWARPILTAKTRMQVVPTGQTHAQQPIGDTLGHYKVAAGSAKTPIGGLKVAAAWTVRSHTLKVPRGHRAAAG